MDLFVCFFFVLLGVRTLWVRSQHAITGRAREFSIFSNLHRSSSRYPRFVCFFLYFPMFLLFLLCFATATAPAGPPGTDGRTKIALKNLTLPYFSLCFFILLCFSLFFLVFPSFLLFFAMFCYKKNTFSDV